ncbi:MAG: hypothetical protein ABII18_09285 [bacterium]|nr:hypothetical protein [bacterium]MBU1918324.1 hypothetical protein [bacterium]
MDAQLSTRIDAQIKQAIETTCKKMGVKLRYFVEEAIVDKLEEILDANEIKQLRSEPTVSFEKVIKDLEKNGKI